MARPLRIQYDGVVYHVTSRGNARKPIFKDEADRETFLNLLGRINQRDHWIGRACRVTHGYTQRRVADYLGMHYATISRLTHERNTRYKT